jgi:uroporphyrinogen decarboxylase
LSNGQEQNSQNSVGNHVLERISDMIMNSKQRMNCVLNGGKPDRLPVTTHHVMPFFLKNCMNNATVDEFFDRFGLDPILWAAPHRPDMKKREYYNPKAKPGFWDTGMISSDQWIVDWKDVPGQKYPTVQYTFTTPAGQLTMSISSNEYTSWLTERLIKKKSDIDIVGMYATTPQCDVSRLNKIAEQYGDRGIVRGQMLHFDIFGQTGCWQDAACLFGIEELMMATFDDPEWVHSFLKILQARKLTFAESLKGAKYDVLGFGGGDASSTVISPKIFEKFVAPYDAPIIETAHQAGQRIVYHTCGGMMPILEMIAAMKPDVMETFTPVGMGGDVNLAEARKRIPENICMIGGFDQLHFFKNCSTDAVRAEVRRCFNEAGSNGAYIICPSDHFFDADLELLEAYADEARKCAYE